MSYPNEVWKIAGNTVALIKQFNMAIYIFCNFFNNLLFIITYVQGLKLTPSNPPNAGKNQLWRVMLSNLLTIWQGYFS